MEEWRLLDTGTANPAENMAIDEALLISQANGSSPPTIRFYSWSPPAISLGYSQSLDEVDILACQADGVNVVRRITGGRAVLHDDELTYSIVAAENNHRIAGGITESYHKIANGLHLGLRKLGAEVEMARRPEKFSDNTPACFDAPSWYELVWEGKKVTGSAQTRKKHVILQHGSIPLSLDADKFFRLLKFDSEKLRQKLVVSFNNKACGLDLVLNRQVTFGEVRTAVIAGMEEKLNIILTPGILSAEETEISRRLIIEKDILLV